MSPPIMLIECVFERCVAYIDTWDGLMCFYAAITDAAISCIVLYQLLQ